MENDKELKLIGFITDFSVWDDIIFSLVDQFHTKFNVYPNILLASDFTYKKIDMYAQMHPDRVLINNDDGSYETVKTSNVPYNGLCHIVSENCDLMCCLTQELKSGFFMIIFDEKPDFGGEPVPEADAREQVFQLGKSA